MRESNAESHPALSLVQVSALAPAANAQPAALASDLVNVLNGHSPQVLRIDDWWRTATPSARLGLVLRLAAALEHITGLASARLSDPAVQSAGGLPMALALFAFSRRHGPALARNTLLARRYDWRIWRRWCKAAGRPTFNPGLQQLTAFLAEHAPHYKVASLRRLGSTIDAMHQAAGFPPPLKTPLLRGAWQRAVNPLQRETRADLEAREDRRALPRKQAAGLRFTPLLRTIERMELSRPLGLRDAALLATGFDLVARSAELLSLHVEDVEWLDRGAVATIRRSKTDQLGKGAKGYLRPMTSALLHMWLVASGLKRGPIFRSLASRDPLSALPIEDRPTLDRQAVNAIIRRRLRAARLDTDALGNPITEFSAHSLRVGAAQELAAAGFTDIEIMRAGRWTRHESLMRYIEQIRISEGAIARHARSAPEAGEA